MVCSLLPLFLETDSRVVGLPCDRDGNFLDEGAPPPPRPMPLPTDWTPFENRPAFHFAEFAFEKTRMSTEDLNEQLRLWQAYNLLTGNESTMYNSVKDVLTTIDQIPLGDLPWTSFNVRYTGPVNDNSPSWMHQVYTVHMRDTFAVQTNLLKNQDFAGAFDYVPYRAYSQDGRRHWSNLMSGQWSWKQAVSYWFPSVLLTISQIYLGRDCARSQYAWVHAMSHHSWCRQNHCFGCHR